MLVIGTIIKVQFHSIIRLLFSHQLNVSAGRASSSSSKVDMALDTEGGES